MKATRLNEGAPQALILPKTDGLDTPGGRILPGRRRAFCAVLTVLVSFIMTQPARGRSGQDDSWKALEKWRGPSGPYVVISDGELFGALDLDRPGLEKVKSLSAAGNFIEAYKAWGTYWASRKGPAWIFDPAAYAGSMKASLPWIVSVINRQAESVAARQVEAGPYAAKPKGRFIDWAADNGKSEFIGLQYFFWLPPLARAYVFTRDEKYARAFLDIVCSWYDALPDIERFDDVVWNSQLGASLRCVFFLEGYSLLRSSPSLTPELHAKILKILLGHARYVKDVHMREYTDWNGQNTGCAMLACTGSFVPEFRQAAQWRGTASSMAKLHIDRNFHADGGQKELCTQYHMTGLRDLGWAVRALRAAGDDSVLSDPETKARFREAFRWPLKIAFGSGFTPALNSGVVDKEWIAFAAVGAKLFDDPVLRWAVRRYAGKTYIPLQKGLNAWELDESFPEAFDPGKKTLPPDFKSILLEGSGFAILRDGWDADSLCLVLDFGKPWGGHGYPGKLSFTLWGRGALLAAHPGSPSSYSLPVYSEWCTQTISHNTVRVGERSQARPFDADLGYWRDLGRVVFLSAGTDTNSPVKHARTVAFVTGEYFIIFDRLKGAANPAVAEWLIHCPTGLRKGPEGRMQSPGRGPGLQVVSPPSENFSRVELGNGHGAVPVEWSPGWKPQDAWRDDIDFASYGKDIGADGLTFVFALIPYGEHAPEASLVSVPVLGNGRAVPEAEARAVELNTGETSDTHLCVFGERRVFSFRGIETDARQAWVRRDRRGRVLFSEMVDGTYLDADGRRVLTCEKNADSQ
jgi:heparan-sulfate lyase